MSGVADDDRLALASIWWGTAAPGNDTLRRVLRLARLSGARGAALPPFGLVADVLQMAEDATSGFATQHNLQKAAPAAGAVSGWDQRLRAAYRLEILGRLRADPRMEAAMRAARLYADHDIENAFVFLFHQLTLRTGWRLPSLSARSLQLWSAQPAVVVWQESWRLAQNPAIGDRLQRLYHDGCSAFRRCAEPISAADLLEIEHGTAALRSSQRLALRQVIEVVSQIDAAPVHEYLPQSSRDQVATSLAAAGEFPAGGYQSLATRGPLENLLHAQLAYMEDHEDPDLFDMKLVNNELLYYARDDNVFARRHSCLVWRLHPDLVRARVQDAGQRVQRISCVLALVVACSRQLADRLGRDGLHIVIHSDRHGDGAPALADELELLKRLLQAESASGLLEFELSESAKSIEFSNPGAATARSGVTVRSGTENVLRSGTENVRHRQSSVMNRDVISISYDPGPEKWRDSAFSPSAVTPGTRRYVCVGGTQLQYLADSASAISRPSEPVVELPQSLAGWRMLATHIVAEVQSGRCGAGGQL